MTATLSRLDRGLHRVVTFVLCAGMLASSCHADEVPADVVIYGATSAGVTAAIQAKRMGSRVTLIEPTRRVGGLTTGGLGQTDIGNKAAIGGLAREFYRAVKRHYAAERAWTWQPSAAYRSGGQSETAPHEDAMWTFEPSVALEIFERWLAEHDIEIVYGERLNRADGVRLAPSDPPRIAAIGMESGRMFSGKVFIDATYEGDLLAAAGVGFTVGREAASTYGETLNGNQPSRAVHHQLRPGVSPYVTPGQPASGLLPFIEDGGPGEVGAGDHRVQAYCFRMCLTDHPDNRIPFEKPEGYEPLWYELLLRNFEAGETAVPWINSAMPNRKTDTNNKHGVSTNCIGQSYGYAEASYEGRQEIVSRHRLYQQGLLWTLANHPRVPEQVRAEVSKWGTCKDEFTDGRGWQEQIYVREARRMIGAIVMTQHHCQGRATAADSVGLAAYTMDSHHVRRYITPDGDVRNEGDIQVSGFPPYPIGYGAILPRTGQCGNLLVPVCVSASHIAYGSIRMEPVFMVLGQSAATAAVLAIRDRVAVQDVDRARLRQALLEDHQILTWPPPQAR